MTDTDAARKRIAEAQGDKMFMAALLNRDHREHRAAVEDWSKLHEAAYATPARAKEGVRGRPFDGPAPNRSPATLGDMAQGRSRRIPVPDGKPARSGGSGDSRNAGDGHDLISERALAGQRGAEPPVVNLEADRIRVLLNNEPARFEISENPDANPNYGAWRTVHALGRHAVQENEATVEREARAQGVDPDLVKAILYVERAQGCRDLLFEALGVAGSLHPMNIRPDPWSAIGDPPADLSDPETNIRIAVTLIRRITERIDDPTPAKVASIWNFTGRETVNDYGARVQNVYERRLWSQADIDPPDHYGTP